MKQVLLHNATVISMNPGREIFMNGDVLIEDDRIAAVGYVNNDRIRPGEKDVESIDCTGKIVMPGLINTHVHTSQQFERGLADDVDLLTWLHDRTWPFESSLTEEDSYWSSLLCGCELIRSGVTTFAEAGGQHVDGMGRAVTELGVRAALCQSALDCGEGLPEGWVKPTTDMLAMQVAQHERWHGKADGRIRHWFGLRTIFNNSDDLIVRTKQAADERGTGVHMHVAEIADEIRFVQQTRGASTVEHLHRLGVLGPNLLAVHTVWMTPREIDLFALHGVQVSHNPAAAMRVLGFAFVPEMLDRGMAVSIGTDGAPSNNRMDMFDEMYLTALIHKGRRLDSAIVPAERVLEMATINGARAMLWDAETGSLGPGKKADLIVVNPRHPGSLPVHNPVSQLVYAMHSQNVESSMCDGRWLMRDGTILSVNEEQVMDQAVERAEAIRQRANVPVVMRFPVRQRP